MHHLAKDRHPVPAMDAHQLGTHVALAVIHAPLRARRLAQRTDEDAVRVIDEVDVAVRELGQKVG
jgi:hypothetical protein